MLRRISNACALLGVVGILTTSFCAAAMTEDVGEATSGVSAVSGALKPVGPPASPPQKYEVGEVCVIDLIQEYEFTGALSGTAVIDYRIIVKGPCGVPPGTYDEEWIAHGSFQGVVNGIDVAGKLGYTARVIAGGDVEGQIQLGQGVEGDLRVFGNFSDGKLSYEGQVK